MARRAFVMGFVIGCYRKCLSTSLYVSLAHARGQFRDTEQPHGVNKALSLRSVRDARPQIATLLVIVLRRESFFTGRRHPSDTGSLIAKLDVSKVDDCSNDFKQAPRLLSPHSDALEGMDESPKVGAVVDTVQGEAPPRSARGGKSARTSNTFVSKHQSN